MQLIIGAALLLIAAIAGFLFLSRTPTSGKIETKKPAVHSISKPQSKRGVSILFGTQTGTAERFAKELKESLVNKYGIDTLCTVTDLEDYAHEEELSHERLVFLVVATYGEGEPTTTATTFVSYITDMGNSAIGKHLLQGLKFGVFGLGNRQYEDFCAVGRKVQKAMIACGANPVIGNGEGDDDANIQADFDQWKQQLLDVLDPSDVTSKAAP